jgi:uncharacterized SAM-binding protein YcdF (DUF218 family)
VNLVATRWWSMLVMPSCVLMAAIALGVFLMLRAWQRGKRPGQARFACWLTAASVMMLYLASTPLVARWAAWTLERDYPPVDVKALPVADAIVVLGGAMYATQGADGVVHLYAHHAGDRFETALAAFRAGRAKLIVFGGGETGVPGTPTEGEWNRQRAIARGIPAERAIAGPKSLYTADESEGITALLKGSGVRTVIVCSSAMHLPRAANRYQALGFQVIPLPCDFATRDTAEAWSWALLTPRGLGLAQVDSAVKEWMGRATDLTPLWSLRFTQ